MSALLHPGQSCLFGGDAAAEGDKTSESPGRRRQEGGLAAGLAQEVLLEPYPTKWWASEGGRPDGLGPRPPHPSQTQCAQRFSPWHFRAQRAVLCGSLVTNNVAIPGRCSPGSKPLLCTQSPLSSGPHLGRRSAQEGGLASGRRQPTSNLMRWHIYSKHMVHMK